MCIATGKYGIQTKSLLQNPLEFAYNYAQISLPINEEEK